MIRFCDVLSVLFWVKYGVEVSYDDGILGLVWGLEFFKEFGEEFGRYSISLGWGIKAMIPNFFRIKVKGEGKGFTRDKVVNISVFSQKFVSNKV